MAEIVMRLKIPPCSLFVPRGFMFWVLVFLHWSPPSHAVYLNSQAVFRKSSASLVRWPVEIRFYLCPNLSYFVTELMWAPAAMKWWIRWGSDFSPGCQMTASWLLVKVSMLLSLSFTIWLQCLTWLELKKSAWIYGTRDLSVVAEVWECFLNSA